MKKLVYHGSKNVIETPIFGEGRTNNDYGKGFYCTENIDLAKEWGVSRKYDGYANCYNLDLDGLQVLDLSDAKYCALHWITLLLKHRQFDDSTPLATAAKQYLNDNFSLCMDGVDVIIGYRADDSYFAFASDFVRGLISYEHLTQALYFGELGEQIVCVSKKAFSQISFLGYEKALSSECIKRKEARDSTARKKYLDSNRTSYNAKQLYIQKILDEEVKPDDARLRKNVLGRC